MKTDTIPRPKEALIVAGQFLRFVFDSFMHHRGLENARSMTFTSLFAVVPLLTLTIAILSVFPAFQVFGDRVQEMLFQRLLPGATDQFETYLSSFADQARNITWVGALMLLATAYLMLVSIETNFNRIWGVGSVRKGMSSFLLYWSMLTLGPLLLGLGFAISSYVTSLTLFEAITEVSASVGVNNILLKLFPVVFSSLGFTLLYVAVPNCGVRLSHGFAGGLAVSLAFVAVKQLFTWFIGVTSYQFVYGTFAAVPVFLLWVYVSWVVILFGANLVRSIPLFKTYQTHTTVHPTLLMLALVHDFWAKHQRGESLKVEELVREKWPFQGIQIEEYLDTLVANGIVYGGTQDEYLLARDLKTLSMWEVIVMLPWPLPRADDMKQHIPDVVARHLPGLPELRKRFESIETESREIFGESVDDYFRLESGKGDVQAFQNVQ